MLNRLTFLSLAAGATGLAACGRQVTPDPSALNGNNNLAGKMVIRFRVRGTLDFVNVNYVIAFNTSGVGNEPYPQAYLTSYLNLNYAFAVGASYGQTGAVYPTLFQYIPTPTGGLNPREVQVGPSLTQLELSDSSADNEFQIIFTREQLNNPLGFETPNPGATVTPSPSPTPTVNPSASPTATPVPGFAATTSPIPNVQPTTYGQTTWLINFFTLDKNNVVLDSLGPGGATDDTYILVVDTATSDTIALNRPAGIIGPTNTSAFIDGGEIDNYP